VRLAAAKLAPLVIPVSVSVPVSGKFERTDRAKKFPPDTDTGTDTSSMTYVLINYEFPPLGARAATASKSASASMNERIEQKVPA
jgi:hypothetical protein